MKEKTATALVQDSFATILAARTKDGLENVVPLLKDVATHLGTRNELGFDWAKETIRLEFNLLSGDIKVWFAGKLCFAANPDRDVVACYTGGSWLTTIKRIADEMMSDPIQRDNLSRRHQFRTRDLFGIPRP